jgi:hypothetical protein
VEYKEKRSVLGMELAGEIESVSGNRWTKKEENYVKRSVLDDALE